MKKGATSLAMPIVIALCIIMLMLLTVQILNYITPFVYYQKLDNIATKYMFVVEKFGYLTQNEKQALENELVNEGFDKSRLQIIYPAYKQAYGSLISLELIYNYNIKIIGFLSSNEKETVISVKKNSFSKIY